jgi:O-antigen chain-terminating methyltransferase
LAPPAESDPQIPRELDSWREHWEQPGRLPIGGRRRLTRPLLAAARWLVRPLARLVLREQRLFDLFLIEALERVRHDVGGLDRARAELHRDLLEVRGDLLRDLRQHADRLAHLEGFDREVFADLMTHNDALFARLDQKLDRYRRDGRELMAKAEALLAAANVGGTSLARASEDVDYLALEDRFRGSESLIAERVAVYLPYLDGGGAVLDLGCGRGEALDVLRSAGVDARGVDSSAEMVRRCRERGVPAEQGDLVVVLAAQPEGRLRGVVSFHVVEHLPVESLRGVVRLAWRALAPGGVLILETPNPLSLVVAARNFWLDPTHRRPVHPAALQWLYEEAGFVEIERRDLQPFPPGERLPEVDPSGLTPELAALAYQVNALRDRLDELLFGCQDYALIGRKASG